MIQSVSAEFTHPQSEIPKVDRKILSVTHRMLDILASIKPEQEAPDVNIDELEAHPHRWSGAAPHASTIQAVRRAMADQTLPEYRELSKVEMNETPEKTPVTHLNLICEVGLFARLDPLHRQRLSAIALWKPKNSKNFITHFYPLFVDLTATSLAENPFSHVFKPDDNDDMCVRTILDLYDKLYAQRPHPTTDINDGDKVLTQNPESDITKRVADIDLQAQKAGEKHLFTLNSPTIYFPRRRSILLDEYTNTQPQLDHKSIWIASLNSTDRDIFKFTQFPRHRL